MCWELGFLGGGSGDVFQCRVPAPTLEALGLIPITTKYKGHIFQHPSQKAAGKTQGEAAGVCPCGNAMFGVTCSPSMKGFGFSFFQQQTGKPRSLRVGP